MTEQLFRVQRKSNRKVDVDQRFLNFNNYSGGSIMRCRIGMTTDREKRKGDWENKYPDLSDWKILGTYKTKSEAQQAETSFAKKYSCDSSPGGDGDEYATWYVYKFSFKSPYEDEIY